MFAKVAAIKLVAEGKVVASGKGGCQRERWMPAGKVVMSNGFFDYSNYGIL